MRGHRMIKLAYTIAGYLLTPFLSLWLFRRAARGKEEQARLRERFGYAALARPAGRLVWLHAASVGEVQSVLALVRALLDRYEDIQLLITTGTVTSARLVTNQKLPRTIHQYIPIDTHASIKRFLNHWQPDLALWVESEFWPQLLWQLKQRRVPTLLINARMSAHSLKGWQRSPRTIRSMLHCFTMIYAGSSEDAERLRLLGATEVIEAGNLKYDAAALPASASTLGALGEMCGQRIVWLAASTHANEEQMVAEMHRTLADKIPGLLTAIVPRHARRGDAIAADLRSRGIKVAQRSRSEPITHDTAIYLADTMGELGIFYRLSGVVFLGGSLVAHGGQNPLEPARLNCAIVTGPHTHNFAAIVTDLRRAEALRQVADVEQLKQAVLGLLTDDTSRKAMAARAAAAVNAARGAGARILQSVETILGDNTPLVRSA